MSNLYLLLEMCDGLGGGLHCLSALLVLECYHDLISLSRGPGSCLSNFMLILSPEVLCTDDHNRGLPNQHILKYNSLLESLDKMALEW